MTIQNSTDWAEVERKAREFEEGEEFMKTIPLTEYMTFAEIITYYSDQSVRIAVAKLNGWYVKGSTLVVIALAGGREFPHLSFKCTETGKENALFHYERELWY